MNKKERFVQKARDKFGDKYDYSEAEYENSQTKIKIKCNEHDHFFYQTPAEHLRNKKGCEFCKETRITDTDVFIQKAKETHGEIYDYSNSEYVDSETKVKIICPKHGEFEQLPINHVRGQGCPECGFNKRTESRKYDTETFIQKAKETHGEIYDYSEVNYTYNQTKVKIKCPEHGPFYQTPAKHLYGRGCPKCSIESKRKKLRFSFEEFEQAANEVHNNKYDYSKVDYINAHTKVKIICPEHGEFEQISYDHMGGHGCSKCSSSVSQAEMEIDEFLRNNGVETIMSSCSIIPPYQLDIYIPEHNIAIEYNGLYWHNELRVDKNYHLTKTNECEKKGVQLIHIFEDEWLKKKEIVKSMLLNKLNLTSNKIYGRECQIKEVDSRTSNEFLNNNHLQGESNSSVRIGLFHNDEMVAIMNFNKPRSGIGKETEGYELSRFCTKIDHNVIGGANKLLNYFIKQYKPTKIFSYSNKRYSSGELYRKLGFSKIRTNKPNYWYIFGKERKHRFNFRKNILVKEGYDETKSSREIMLDRGIYRIYDCGTETWGMEF